jgi:hypothetical protein
MLTIKYKLYICIGAWIWMDEHLFYRRARPPENLRMGYQRWPACRCQVLKIQPVCDKAYISTSVSSWELIILTRKHRLSSHAAVHTQYSKYFSRIFLEDMISQTIVACENSLLLSIWKMCKKQFSIILFIMQTLHQFVSQETYGCILHQISSNSYELRYGIFFLLYAYLLEGTGTAGKKKNRTVTKTLQ